VRVWAIVGIGMYFLTLSLLLFVLFTNHVRATASKLEAGNIIITHQYHNVRRCNDGSHLSQP